VPAPPLRIKRRTAFSTLLRVVAARWGPPVRLILTWACGTVTATEKLKQPVRVFLPVVRVSWNSHENPVVAVRNRSWEYKDQAPDVNTARRREL
jgi:hypothetical protein